MGNFLSCWRITEEVTAPGWTAPASVGGGRRQCQGRAPPLSDDAVFVRTVDQGSVREPRRAEHADVDAAPLAEDGLGHDLTDRRAELEPVAAESRGDEQPADAVRRAEHRLPVRGDIVEAGAGAAHTHAPAPP